MKIVTTPKAVEYIAANGGKVWVWLDPRRGLVGSYVWLESHAEPPGASRRSRVPRGSQRPHRFSNPTDAGLGGPPDFGGPGPPEGLPFHLKGRTQGPQRLQG